MAKQIVKLGDIPKEEITPSLVMELAEIDFRVLAEAKEAFEKRLFSFRSKAEDPEKTDTGPNETGV